MNKLLLLLFFLCSCTKPEIIGELGNWEWFKIIGKSGSNSIISQYVDEKDNIYLLINFSGDKIELDQKTFETEGSSNFLVAKLTSDGELIWAEKFGKSGSVHGLDLAFNEGKLFITGEMGRNYVTKESGIVSKKNWTLNTDVRMPFILKLDIDGNTEWIKTIPKERKNSFNSITITESNRIFITTDYSGEDNFPILLFKGDSAKPEGSINSGIIEISESGNLIDKTEFEGNYLGYKSKVISKGDSTIYVVHGLTCFNQVEAQRGREKCLMQYGYGNKQIDVEKKNSPVFVLRNFFLENNLNRLSEGYVKVVRGVNIYDLNFYNESGILTTGSYQTDKNEEGEIEVSFSKYDSNGNLLWNTYSSGSQTTNSGIAIIQSGNQIIATGSFIPPISFSGFEFKSENPDDQFQARSFFLAVLDSTGIIESVIRNYPLMSSSGDNLAILKDGVLISGDIAGRTRFDDFRTTVINGSNSFIGKYRMEN
ncbi:MAG: hypothetical protein JXR11_07710 [Balneola sp.]